MRHRRGQLDVAHALTANLGLGDLDAALVADDALEAGALVLAAVALPVLGGAEDALAEQAVALGLQGSIVDGFRLYDLAVRPLADLLRRCEANADGIQFRQFKQGALSFLSIGARRRSRRACLLPSEIVVQHQVVVAQLEIVEVEVLGRDLLLVRQRLGRDGAEPARP